MFPDARNKQPRVIAFDTSGPFVSVGAAHAGYAGGEVLDMARGQAENLFPAIERLLARSDWSLNDVDAIGVCVGPGNFTGIRISVSAARGLGLALGIPVFGLTQFELAYGSSPVPSGILVSVPAPRDMAYVQVFGTGLRTGSALLIDPTHPPTDLQLSFGMQVYGHRALEIASHFDATGHEQAYRPDPAEMAGMVEALYTGATVFPPPPAPNYVKPPDAAPARDTPPRIIA